MSRLIENFQKAMKAAATPMGFRTARRVETPPKIQLIAAIEAGTSESPLDYLNPADAILIRFTEAAFNQKLLQKITSSLGDIPWGLYLEDDEKTAEAGGDFIVLSPASRVSEAPKDSKAGKILEAESSMDDSLLRAANDLPVDAVLVAGAEEDKGPLVWHQLMIYQHLANMLNKPLIVQLTADITENELKVLWDAGVDGLIVAADAGRGPALQELRRAIEKLPARAGRKRGKIEARLPRVASARTAAPDEGEEEEEEDE